MVDEGISFVKEALQMEPVQVQLEVGEFIDKLTALFPQDRIDGGRKTYLFALAVKNRSTRKTIQYVAVTTENHCSGNHTVGKGKFRIQVKTKDGEPGTDWHHCRFWNKGGGVEWWEIDPHNQTITKEIIECVLKARDCMAG